MEPRDQIVEECAESSNMTFSSAIDVDVVDLRAQADASMPASNNNVSYTVYSNF